MNSVSPSNTRPWTSRPNSFNPTSHSFRDPDKEGIKASFEEWISLKTRPYQLDLIGRAPFQPESFLLNFSVTEFQSSSLHLPSIPKWTEMELAIEQPNIFRPALVVWMEDEGRTPYFFQKTETESFFPTSLTNEPHFVVLYRQAWLYR